jgi:glycosyltransferase involved in cell wall biosynthesis
MRAGMVLQALAGQYLISLLVVPLYPPFDRPVPLAIRALCHQSAIVPYHETQTGRPARLSPWQWLRRSMPGASAHPQARDARVEAAGRVFRQLSFDVIHVFRLSMLPFAQPYLDHNRKARRHLDLDDIESRTRKGLAALYRVHGMEQPARIEAEEAARHALLEREVLQRFDRVYVCSQGDRARLAADLRAQVCVLPNAVRTPAPVPVPDTRALFTFLFVGTLGYFPNVDAIHYFCTSMVPLLRRSAPRDFQVTIVGTGETAVLGGLARVPEVRIVGEVPDVMPWYRDAHAVVAPLRAGGGTRIKILEAFSYGRPVVSTSIGIEGIDARQGEHVLVADTPEAFTQHCVQLMADPALADRLAANALDLFRRAYTPEAVTRSLAACGEPPRQERRSGGASPAPR